MLEEEAPYPQPVDYYKYKSQPQQTEVTNSSYNKELRDLVNRLGQRNLQSKFSITDGSSNVNVTFWDALAKKFVHDLMQQIEDPVIIIITSCKVGTWNDQVDISNVATTYYLNHEHHSVKEIRKMLSNPNFTKKALQAKRKKKAKLMTIADIKKLGKESIEAEVITHANIQSVEETNVWYYSICTRCKQVLECKDGSFMFSNCNRRIPPPKKRYNISIVASDETGDIKINLDDREVRTLIRKRAEEIYKKQNGGVKFPKELKKLENIDITVKLIVKEVNVFNQAPMYWANNICQGFYTPEEPKPDSTTASTSTFHLDGMSTLNFETPQTKNK
ncbi:hypothetical protein POM88_020471 [Heracleum sosnowskyi]|uniref:Replication factor A C-terminal domain-containing protein n=1 Tax=Heracleum sosnowskyi TaxID=360622 RepID=A0AAD8ICY6_9APIA|nr:hypothetical protein POM88_020471 [Heracleum sosnowskyi]